MNDWLNDFIYMEKYLAQKLVCIEVFYENTSRHTKKEKSKITKKSTIFKNLLSWNI